MNVFFLLRLVVKKNRKKDGLQKVIGFRKLKDWSFCQTSFTDLKIGKKENSL